jgi:glycosyltransferase involved in cell wall biosynthesis
MHSSPCTNSGQPPVARTSAPPAKRVLLLSYSWLVHDPPLLNLAALLAERGHSVRAIGIGRPTDLENEEPAQNVRISRVRYSKLSSVASKLTLAVRYTVCAAIEVLRKAPDVCVAFNWNSYLVAVVARLVRGSTLVYYQTEYNGRTAGELSRLSIQARIAVGVERHLVRYATVLFASEPHRAELMKRDYELPYLPQAVYNCPRRSVAAVEPDAGTGLVKMVYFGHIGPKTCIPEVIEAAEQSSRDVILDLWGPIDSRYEDDFRATLASDRTRRCHYRGAAPYGEARAILGGYDVGLVFYRPDSVNQIYCSPAKLFEYLSTGLAILGSDVPGIRGAIGASQVGILAADNSVAAIREGIEAFADRRTDLRAMQRRALALFRSHLNYESQSRGLVERIEQ